MRVLFLKVFKRLTRVAVKVRVSLLYWAFTVPRWRRGNHYRDGRITLLTVDFGLTDQVLRLAASFRRHVEANGAVVVVQNGSRAHNTALRSADLKVVGLGRNIGHGPALDLGLRHVTTQYVLVCDPDAFILNDDFRAVIMERLSKHKVCGIVLSYEPEHQRYHPICTAFETSLWKHNKWSMRDDWSVPHDVGGALTAHLGGLNPDATIPATHMNHNGVVWAGSFTNTFRMSRIRDLSDDDLIDGYRVSDVRDYHVRWEAWVDRVAAGVDGVDGVPLWDAPYSLNS